MNPYQYDTPNMKSSVWSWLALQFGGTQMSVPARCAKCGAPRRGWWWLTYWQSKRLPE